MAKCNILQPQLRRWDPHTDQGLSPGENLFSPGEKKNCHQVRKKLSQVRKKLSPVEKKLSPGEKTNCHQMPANN